MKTEIIPASQLISYATDLQRDGKLAEAIVIYLSILDQIPEYVGVRFNLAKAYQDTYKDDEAIKQYVAVLKLDPSHRQAHINVGILYDFRGQYERALKHYLRAIEIDPHVYGLYPTAATIMLQLARSTDAIDICKKCLDLNPTFIGAAMNLAGAYTAQGRTSTAADVYRDALKLDPAHYLGHSNYLFILNHSESNLERIASEHRRWGEMHAAKVHKAILPPYTHDRIRIGYVSPDFRRHVMGSNILPILKHHDRDQFEITCYHSNVHEDEVTHDMHGMVDHWRDVSKMDYEAMTRRVLTDEIDILVDLAGHTANNRLPVFAARAAPVQITYCGYVNTTGMTEMDYRLTDELVEPPDLQPYFTEKLLYVPNSSCCYMAPWADCEVAPPPCLKNGYVTFGSFNNLVKTSGAVVKLWCEVLKAVPRSRFVLKAKFLKDEIVANRYRSMFKEHGVSEDRVDLLSWVEGSSHLAPYSLIDVALDTFPFGGGITTFEAAWAGVPTVTMAGRNMAGRMGVRINTILNNESERFGEGIKWIACSNDQYIELAKQLSKPIRNRYFTRAILEGSTLMDGAYITKNIEFAYRAVYKKEVCH